MTPAPDERRRGDHGFLLDGEIDVAALPIPDGPAPGAPASTAQPTAAAERLAESVRRVPAGRWSAVSADDVRDVLAEVDRLTARRTELVHGLLAASQQAGEMQAERDDARAALERVRAVSVTYADAVRGLSQNGSERDVARARHYRALLRDLDAALSAGADASEED